MFSIVDEQVAAPCPADIGGNRVVDFGDILVILSTWGVCLDCAGCPADVNGDCSVDFADVLLVLGEYGPC